MVGIDAKPLPPQGGFNNKIKKAQQSNKTDIHRPLHILLIQEFN